MGIGYSNKHALIPAYRTDILHPIDLVEDIAIAYGYDNIKPSLSSIATIAEEDAVESFRNKLASILTSLNLLEVNSYHLISMNDNRKAYIGDVPVELESSLSTEYNALRTSLIPSMLKTLNANKHHSYPQDIFEIAKVFKKSKNDVIESYSLCITLCNRQSDFTRIKQILDALLLELGLHLSITEQDHPLFINGRSAIIKASGKKLGNIGEIYPDVLNNFSIDIPVSLLEINIEDLLDALKSK